MMSEIPSKVSCEGNSSNMKMCWEIFVRVIKDIQDTRVTTTSTCPDIERF